MQTYQDDRQLNSLADAEELITTTNAVGSSNFDTINLFDSPIFLGDNGRFNGDDSFPDVNPFISFATVITGHFQINSTDFYELGLNVAEGAVLKVDGLEILRSDDGTMHSFDHNREVLAPTMLFSGLHSIELVSYRGRGFWGALEFFFKSESDPIYRLVPSSSVSEPTIFTLMGIGLAGIAWTSRKKRL